MTTAMNRIRRHHRSIPILSFLLTPLLAPSRLAVVDASDRIARDYFVEGTRQPDCEVTMIPFERAAARYMEKGNDLTLRASDSGKSVAIQTSHSEEANEEFREICEAAGGAWTEITAALHCVENWASDEDAGDGMNETLLPDDEDDSRMDETDVFIRNGRCFPRNDECEHYVRNPIDWEIDTQKLYGLTCAQDSVGGTYSALLSGKTIPSPLLKYQGTFVDWSDDYDEAKRHKCQEAINSIFTNEKYELYRSGTELYQVSPVLIRKEYFAGDVGGMARYEQYCRDIAEGARLDAWNGTMDCVGVGANNKGMKLTTLVENVAECFPPGNACESYTAETWTMDNMMDSSFSCTVRGRAGGELFHDEGGGGGKRPNPKENDGEDGEVGDDRDGRGETDHRYSMPVIIVAGLSILASAAFVSRRRSVRSRAAAPTMSWWRGLLEKGAKRMFIYDEWDGSVADAFARTDIGRNAGNHNQVVGGNAVVYRTPEISNASLEMT